MRVGRQDFDGMIPALKAKKFDGVLSSMSMTPQRAEQIALSSKLFNTPTRLVAKGSGIVPSAESLKGKTVPSNRARSRKPTRRPIGSRRA